MSIGSSAASEWAAVSCDSQSDVSDQVKVGLASHLYNELGLALVRA